MTQASAFFRAIAVRNMVRPRVAGIVFGDGEVLVQRPVDDPDASYAFVGGAYEVGDTFQSRLEAEFDEETNCRIVRADYLFVVENRFEYDGRLIHGLEHYFYVEIDRHDVKGREKHLSFHWLPLETLAEYDIQPHVVRDVITSAEFRDVRHLVVSYETS